MGFRGTYTAKVDEKGRLKVPARFKHQLDEDFPENKYYITSLDGKSAKIYPIAEWERLEEHVKRLDQNEESRIRWFRITSYYGQEVEMDGQGRLLLPSRIRIKANLHEDVDVVGLQECMEVTNSEALARLIEDEPYTSADATVICRPDR